MCSLDPFRGYATALSTSLPHAVRVLDAFHVVHLGSAAVDDVRRRRQQETLGRRGHRDDPLYRARRLLRRDFTTLTERQMTRLGYAHVARSACRLCRVAGALPPLASLTPERRMAGVDSVPALTERQFRARSRRGALPASPAGGSAPP